MNLANLLTLLCGVCCSVFAKVIIPPDLQEDIDRIHDACVAKGGITPAQFESFQFDKEDRAVRCYMKCAFVEAKWMDDDENLQYDYIRETIHHSIRHITLPELDNCGKAAVGTQDCEKSYNFFYCMHLAEPEDWIIL